MSMTTTGTAASDPFDSLLTIEDTLYTSSYEQGSRDGALAGRVEGRVFGLEKGFEKFVALGRLHGRAVVWESCINQPPVPSPTPSITPRPSEIRQAEPQVQRHLASLPSPLLLSAQTTRTARLRNNIETLLHLTDPLTFSTLNTDDAVADYDDRFKRAGAKCKIIQRAITHTSNFTSSDNALEDIGIDGDFENIHDTVTAAGSGHGTNFENSASSTKAKMNKKPKKVGGGVTNHQIAKKSRSDGRKDDNMEDFSLFSHGHVLHG